MLTYIYELYDPRDPETVWYVGVSRNPEKRLRQHLCAPRYHNSRKYDWIHGLLDAGVQPAVRITQSIPVSEWQEKEQCWILWYRLENPQLTNLADGGNGGGNHTHTESVRRRISAAQKGRQVSADTRRKLSEANRGKKMSEEHYRKLREALRGKKRKPHSEETRRKIGEGGRRFRACHPRNPVSEETRRKMSETRRGKKHPHVYRPDLITDDLVRLYQSGLSTTELGRRFAASPSAIHHRLKHAGIVFRPNPIRRN